MIPVAFVNAWRTTSAPWSTPDQVEQDLVLSRSIVALFNDPVVADALVFRGGTALHKLHLRRTSRYSNDLDFVQRAPGPIGPILDAVRAAMLPWLPGKPRYKAGEKMATLTYGFASEGPPSVPLKLKLEINSREHGAVHPVITVPFAVENPWFSGSVSCPTFQLAELMGTKLRALYQRRKGRDLFDLWLVLTTTDTDAEQVVRCFHHYTDAEQHPVTRAEFAANIQAKRSDAIFRGDMDALLSPETRYDIDAGFDAIEERIIPLIRA